MFGMKPYDTEFPKKDDKVIYFVFKNGKVIFYGISTIKKVSPTGSFIYMETEGGLVVKQSRADFQNGYIKYFEHNDDNIKKLEHFKSYKEEEKKLADLAIKFLHGREAHNMCANDLYIIERIIMLFEQLFDPVRTEQENYMWLNWHKIEKMK